MAAALLSSPTLSSSFHGRRLFSSIQRYSKKGTPWCFSSSSPRCAGDMKVTLSLAACIYFLNDNNKSLLGGLVVGWICGSFLVPPIPSFLLQPSWTLELLTSLVAYVFMFLGCTFIV